MIIPGTKTLLRQAKWVFAALAVIAFSVTCFTVLSPWQLGKATAVERRTALIAHAGRTPAVPLEDVAPAGGPLNPADEWRQVILRGHFLRDHQVTLLDRSPDPRSATEILTPFRSAGSDVVILVDRGTVNSVGPDVSSAPPGQVEISGRLRASETTTTYKQPRIEHDGLIAYSIDPSLLAKQSKLDFAPYYVQLATGQPGSLGAIPQPPPDETLPYASYGIQWLVFGAAAPLLLVLAAWRAAKEAQRSRGVSTLDPAVEF